MEKVVGNYIRDIVGARYMGINYRASRSTETALYQLTRIIERSIEQREICLCAFLNIEDAFDNISHKILEIALERKKPR